MKNSRSIVYKRQQQIIQRLKEERSIPVGRLAAELAVTPITIRRDLQMLEDQGVLHRFHGGATIAPQALREDPALSEPGWALRQEKQEIARYAAGLVEEGDAIFLNSSSTALLMLQFLGGKRVTVITNNGKALLAERDKSVELVLTGGEVSRSKQSMVGDFAVALLGRIVASKAFLGVGGISAANGVTTSFLQETMVNDIMMRRCGGHCHILADSSKVGSQNNFQSGSIDLVQTLVTGAAADGEELARLRAGGVAVVQVGCGEDCDGGGKVPE